MLGEMQAIGVLLAVAGGDHGGGWIDDFGLVLVAAAIAVTVFHLLRQPVIFGYLLAGVLIGPNLFPVPLVEDREAIAQISELGIIFLLFFIGMEFDLKRLQRVFVPALLALILQTLFMLYLAQVLGGFWGWSSTSTVFFGSLLAISSSMVTVRVLRDTDRMREASTQFTIGILILEDVLAVLLLVILTGVAVTQTFDWDAAWLVTFLMGIFVVGVFLVGRSLVPRLLQKLSGDETDPEVVTLVSAGLVMGVSVLALKLQFSPALGAFIAGTMLSQTQMARRVETINRSLHDVFSAVFFVSIGMQLDPFVLVEQLPAVVVVSLLVVFGKVLTCWVGLCLGGQGGRTAFLASVPKAQIGEFSFIIAGLGMTLGVMDAQMMTLAYGVALLTIVMTPPLTQRSDSLHRALERFIPGRFQQLFGTYRNFLEGLSHGLGKSVWLKLIRRPVIQIVLYFFLVNGIFIVASVGARWFFAWAAALPFNRALSVGYWVVVGLLMAPFLLAMFRNLNALSYILAEALFADAKRAVLRNRLRQMLSAAILAAFVFLLGLIFLLVASPYLPRTAVAGIAFFIVATLMVFLRSRMILVNSHMELMFADTFRAEVASKEEQRRVEVLEMIQKQSPWPVQIVDLTLPLNALWSGKRLKDLQLRSRFGVNVLGLGRYQTVHYDPPADAVLFSGDRLILTGSPEGLEGAKVAMLEQISEDRPVPGPDQFRLERVYVTPGTALDGETLAGAHVRKRFGVTIIGVQRDEEQITNPSPDFLLDAGDVLLVAGLPRKIDAFSAACREKPLPKAAE
jgi:CPA2 family monovalent cation:H+ antiporter-2